MLKLSIVCLTYNRDDLLFDCLNSIDKQDIPVSNEIIVVNNGGPLINVGMKRNCKIVNYHENAGVVRGVNRCFEAANGEFVLFVSNDVSLNKDCIKFLWDRIHLDPVSQIQPTIYKPSGKIDNAGMDYVWPGYGIGRLKYKKAITQIIPNIVFMMRKSDWKKVGGFDSNIKMGYEDVDFGLRLKPFVKIVSRRATAIHLGNQTLGKTLKNHKKIYSQSRKYVIKKNFKGVDKWLRLGAVTLLDFINSVIHVSKKM